MAHSSELRWEEASKFVSVAASECIRILDSSENIYQELLEVYVFTGATDQAFADQLFKEVWEARGDTQANTEEVGKAADLRVAITALHELYQAANNVAVAQSDRYEELRRLS